MDSLKTVRRPFRAREKDANRYSTRRASTGFNRDAR